MPSGAKKRKAAKKKLQKEAHNSKNGSHSHGVNDAKTHDGREENVERISVDQENAAEKGDEEVKLAEESYKEVVVDAAVVDREFENGKNKSSSSSSSGGSESSSDDEEVVIEKEKQTEEEVGEVEQQEESSLQDVAVGGEAPESTETVAQEVSVESLVVDASDGESISVVESIKQVVSLPEESGILAESVDEVLQTSDEKTEVDSAVVDSVQEKSEDKVISVLEADSVTVREDESLLPQSSGVEAVNKSNEDENVKESETQKYVEEQPLLSSAVLPVRKTTWMNCCGLFEVLSGVSSR